MILLSSCKKCGKCDKHKLITEFPWTSHRGKRHRRSYCRNCNRIAKKKWADKKKREDPEGFRRRQKNDNLKKTYGITIEQYEDMHRQQGGKCGICDSPQSGQRGHSLHVDHCHETGEIRGLLCHACNTSLGGFRHDPELLKKAIRYLNNNTFCIV